MKRKISPRLFAVAFVLLALACSEELKKTETTPGNDNPLPAFIAPEGIVFNGDYLIFPTPQLFDQTMKVLKASDLESVSVWTAKLGFTSQKDLFTRAINEQDVYMAQIQKQYEGLPSGDPRIMIRPTIPQSSFVAEHVALFDFDEYGRVRRLKLDNPLMDRLVNKDGIVMIAGHIFQYNANNTKIIVGGDDRKIALLPEVNETNEKLNIVVNPVTHTYKTGTPADGNSRISYTYNNSYNSGYYGAYLYYFNYSVVISTRLDPVYDTSNPICDPPGCGQARTSKAQDCYCYYPIISYDAYTLHHASMESRKIWNGTIDTQHASRRNKIDASTSTNFSYWPITNSATNYGYVNCDVVLYDAYLPTNGDFTSGTYDFFQTPEIPVGEFTGGVEHSWTNP